MWLQYESRQESAVCENTADLRAIWEEVGVLEDIGLYWSVFRREQDNRASVYKLWQTKGQLGRQWPQHGVKPTLMVAGHHCLLCGSPLVSMECQWTPPGQHHHCLGPWRSHNLLLRAGGASMGHKPCHHHWESRRHGSGRCVLGRMKAWYKKVYFSVLLTSSKSLNV